MTSIQLEDPKGSVEKIGRFAVVYSGRSSYLMPTGIDLFSGAGGLSLGAANAGIKITAAVESDKYAAATYRRNFEDVRVIQTDISEVEAGNLAKTRPFIVFGGPPCQGFSRANTRTRTIDNAKNHLYKYFVDIVIKLQPDWFLMENVEGFDSFAGGQVKDSVMGALSVHYKSVYATLIASDYGVPQNRQRFFIVGNRKGVAFKFPKPIPFDKRSTVRDAIGDLPRLKNGDMIDKLEYRCAPTSALAAKLRDSSPYSTQNFVSKNSEYVIERYKHIKQGENWQSIPKALMTNYKRTTNCHSSIYRRLKYSEPSIVIANYRKNMLIHPLQNRGLSVREAARLQSFPDRFMFEGSIGFIQQQIGNAVPPLLSEALFKAILRQS